jgi:hypothetical protein
MHLKRLNAVTFIPINCWFLIYLKSKNVSMHHINESYSNCISLYNNTYIAVSRMQLN